MQILINNSAREKTLIEIGKAYWSLYPKRARWFKRMLTQLNEVNKNTDGSYVDPKGRTTTFVKVRVPTELWLFIQRWLPDFGKHSDDLEALRRIWSDFAKVGKDHRRRSLLTPRKKKGDDEGSTDKRSDDRQERSGNLTQVPGQPTTPFSARE
jgi:hypothetical protein